MCIPKLATILILIIVSGCTNSGNPSGPDIESENQIEIDTTDEISPTTYLKSADFNVLMKKYEDPGRGNWQNPNLVIEKLGNLIVNIGPIWMVILLFSNYCNFSHESKSLYEIFEFKGLL